MRRALIPAGAIAAGAVLMLSLAWGLQHAALTSPQLLGRTAPALAIQPPDGDAVSIANLKGRPVVLNFWASWCGPCLQELPVLANAQQAHPAAHFVGANMQDTDSAAAQFESMHPQYWIVAQHVQGGHLLKPLKGFGC